jgi:hypothetical protein
MSVGSDASAMALAKMDAIEAEDAVMREQGTHAPTRQTSNCSVRLWLSRLTALALFAPHERLGHLADLLGTGS